MAKQLPIDGPVIALEEGKRYTITTTTGRTADYEFVGVNLGMYLVGWWLVRIVTHYSEGDVYALNPAHVLGVEPVPSES